MPVPTTSWFSKNAHYQILYPLEEPRKTFSRADISKYANTDKRMWNKMIIQTMPQKLI